MKALISINVGLKEAITNDKIRILFKHKMLPEYVDWGTFCKIVLMLRPIF